MPSRMEGVTAVDGAAGERKGNCEKGDLSPSKDLPPLAPQLGASAVPRLAAAGDGCL